jgi:hypothetical protein
MTLQLLIYEENLVFFFVSVEDKEYQFEENVVNAVQTDYRRGSQGGNKRHAVDAEQVMSPSDAAAAAVGICYYNWNFGDEAYSCKSSAVKLSN